jgi:hypothetical protein
LGYRERRLEPRAAPAIFACKFGRGSLREANDQNRRAPSRHRAEREGSSSDRPQRSPRIVIDRFSLELVAEALNPGFKTGSHGDLILFDVTLTVLGLLGTPSLPGFFPRSEAKDNAGKDKLAPARNEIEAPLGVEAVVRFDDGNEHRLKTPVVLARKAPAPVQILASRFTAPKSGRPGEPTFVRMVPLLTIAAEAGRFRGAARCCRLRSGSDIAARALAPFCG